MPAGQRLEFFQAAEHARVAALQAHDQPACARMAHQQRVDGRLAVLSAKPRLPTSIHSRPARTRAAPGR